jgi:broad specificity phosphatase PhoE
LRGAGFTAVVASDLLRAQETAQLIAEELGLGPVEVVAGLRERNVGAWSGLTTDEIEAKWPGQLDAWRAGQLAQIPEGEGDITERVMAAVHHVLVSHPGDTVLGVTHGGVIRSAERALGVVEPSRVRNVSGRWIIADGGTSLRAGDVVVLPEPDATEPTTTVL